MKKRVIISAFLFLILLTACSSAGPVGKAIAKEGSSVNEYCFDDDNGKESMKEGYLVYKTMFGKKGVHDKCTGEILTENYCDGFEKKSLAINCTPFGMECQKGACTPLQVYRKN